MILLLAILQSVKQQLTTAQSTLSVKMCLVSGVVSVLLDSMVQVILLTLVGTEMNALKACVFRVCVEFMTDEFSIIVLNSLKGSTAVKG